jgi:hypothetical protein
MSIPLHSLSKPGARGAHLLFGGIGRRLQIIFGRYSQNAAALNVTKPPVATAFLEEGEP